MKPRLRPAVAEDALRIAELLIDTRAAFMPYAPAAHSDAEIHAWVADHLLPVEDVTVVEVDGLVIGVMATRSSTAGAWINQMAVAPSHVAQGLGSLLLAHALRTLAPPIRLYSFQANQGARRFYERHGFKAIASTDGRDNEERCPDVLYEWQALEPQLSPDWSR